jgi:hypothetical protein
MYFLEHLKYTFGIKSIKMIYVQIYKINTVICIITYILEIIVCMRLKYLDNL